MDSRQKHSGMTNVVRHSGMTVFPCVIPSEARDLMLGKDSSSFGLGMTTSASYPKVVVVQSSIQ